MGAKRLLVRLTKLAHVQSTILLKSVASYFALVNWTVICHLICCTDSNNRCYLYTNNTNFHVARKHSILGSTDSTSVLFKGASSGRSLHFPQRGFQSWGLVCRFPLRVIERGVAWSRSKLLRSAWNEAYIQHGVRRREAKVDASRRLDNYRSLFPGLHHSRALGECKIVVLFMSFTIISTGFKWLNFKLCFAMLHLLSVRVLVY